MSEAFSLCRKGACATKVPGTVKTCPACGGRMFSSKRTRLAGYVLVLCGLLLVAAGAGLGLYLVPLMRHGSATFHSSATPAQTDAIAMMFAGLAAFGGISLVHGVLMIARGQRSRPLVILSLVVLAMLVAAILHTLAVLPH